MPMVRAQRRLPDAPRGEIRDEIQQQRDEMPDEPPVVQKAQSFLSQWLCDIANRSARDRASRVPTVPPTAIRRGTCGTEPRLR